MSYLVDKYFINVGKKLDKKIIENSPVMLPDTNECVGRIVRYYPRNGYALIKLDYLIFYGDLIDSGVLLEHIVFENAA